MTLPTKINDLLNKQLNQELSAYYSYLGMAAFFEEKSLVGMASWMIKQAGEEQAHAMKIFEFVHVRGGKIELPSIESKPTSYDSPLEAFKVALKQEQENTKSIHVLVEAAQQEKDHATFQFLQWFVEEQVEEENQASEIVDRVTMVASDPVGILRLDADMGARKD